MDVIFGSVVEDWSQVLDHLQKTIDTVEAAIDTRCPVSRTGCPVTKTVYDSLMDLKNKIVYITNRSGIL